MVPQCLPLIHVVTNMICFFGTDMDNAILSLALLSNDDDAMVIALQHLHDKEKHASKKKRFCFNDASNEYCWKMFRFQKDDLRRLKTALHVPDNMTLPNRTVFVGIDGLCIMLRRLAYPSRLCDMEQMFGCGASELGLIFNAMIDFIHERFSTRLTNLDQEWLDIAHLERYANAVTRKGSPLNKCWGFVDGTCMNICRPKHGQEQCYSGHKRQHVLKFQAIMVPCGLIANLYGPVEGRRHDAYMLQDSGILPQLTNKVDRNGEPYYLYGDPAYPLLPVLLAPYRGAQITLQQSNFNKSMTPLRQCVEWGFGDIARNFAFIDFKKNLKLYLSPVAKYYVVACLLTNCKACLYGNITCSYFDVEPPSLEDYLL